MLDCAENRVVKVWDGNMDDQLGASKKRESKL